MTKQELIMALAPFHDDCVCVVGDFNSTDVGWSNIGSVQQTGSVISISEDFTRPFSSDN